MSRESPDREFVEALARGIAVIEAFNEGNAELSLSDVARLANMTPATARRSLQTLETLGYVQHVNKRYMLCAKVLTLGSAYLRAAHVDDVLTPEIRRIVSLFGDAASICVLQGNQILYLAHVSDQRSVRPLAGVGITYPAYATSMGRVLLSGLPTSALLKYLGEVQPERLTGQTETNKDRLLEIIRDAGRKGYATAIDQLAYGVASIAAPIQGPDGRTIAAINSSGYSGHLNEKAMIRDRLPELRASAGRLGAHIARYPALLHSLPLHSGTLDDAADDSMTAARKARSKK